MRWMPIALLLLTGCAAPPPPPKAEQPKADPTLEAGYADAVAHLADLARKAQTQFQNGKPDDAAALITQAQPLQARVLSAPQPTLAAMEAASDLDDLYARMLLSNGREGWARTMYQKNVARWKLWRPKTADTERRLRQAQEGIAACDKRLAH